MPALIHREKAAPKDSRYELPDCFDFHAARDFLRKIKSIPENQLPTTLRIDCHRTRYIDTAGLGCLLLIGEHLGVNRTIRIEGANAEILAMLAIARIEERLAGREANPPDLRTCVDCGRPARGTCTGTLAEATACRRTQPREAKVGTRARQSDALLLATA